MQYGSGDPISIGPWSGFIASLLFLILCVFHRRAGGGQRQGTTLPCNADDSPPSIRHRTAQATHITPCQTTTHPEDRDVPRAAGPRAVPDAPHGVRPHPTTPHSPQQSRDFSPGSSGFSPASQPRNPLLRPRVAATAQPPPPLRSGLRASAPRVPSVPPACEALKLSKSPRHAFTSATFLSTRATATFSNSLTESDRSKMSKLS